jgi:putative phage-type endonuclease
MLKQLEFLKAIPQYKQGSKEWLEQRKGKLTSSDAATALGINPYKKAVQLLLEKCGAGRSFEGNESTFHGQKYEQEAIDKYELLMGKENNTFGMISFSDLDQIRSTRESKKIY